MGDDEEIIIKITIMEAEDDERANMQAPLMILDPMSFHGSVSG